MRTREFLKLRIARLGVAATLIAALFTNLPLAPMPHWHNGVQHAHSAGGYVHSHGHEPDHAHLAVESVAESESPTIPLGPIASVFHAAPSGPPENPSSSHPSPNHEPVPDHGRTPDGSSYYCSASAPELLPEFTPIPFSAGTSQEPNVAPAPRRTRHIPSSSAIRGPPAFEV